MVPWKSMLGLVPKAVNGAAVERHQRPPACKADAMTLFFNYLYSLHTDCTHFLRADITPFPILKLNESQPRGVHNMQRPIQKKQLAISRIC
jgi:hypothetical protein